MSTYAYRFDGQEKLPSRLSEFDRGIEKYAQALLRQSSASGEKMISEG